MTNSKTPKKKAGQKTLLARPAQDKERQQTNRIKNPSQTRQRFPYAQIPIALLRNPSIPAFAKVVFGAYHDHCNPKDLSLNPSTSVSQERLADELGCSCRTIIRKTKEIYDAGWISIQSRGWNRNITTLHEKPKRRNQRISLRKKFEKSR